LLVQEEEDVDLEAFMLLNDDDLKNLDFATGARRKIIAAGKKLQQK
jgi:hypothetical protein